MKHEQLTLDIEWKRNPLECPHVMKVLQDGHVYCNLHGEVYTNCQTSVAGDPPHCVYEPHDNSKEAMARRKEWLRANADKGYAT